MKFAVSEQIYVNKVTPIASDKLEEEYQTLDFLLQITEIKVNLN